jgi:hypothetical protein
MNGSFTVDGAWHNMQGSILRMPLQVVHNDTITEHKPYRVGWILIYKLHIEGCYQPYKHAVVALTGGGGVTRLSKHS